MEYLENIIEYYDELYPVSDGQKSFFSALLKHYEAPSRILRINCASGAFEHALASRFVPQHNRFALIRNACSGNIRSAYAEFLFGFCTVFFMTAS